MANTNDSGPGSLRQAVHDSNSQAGPNRVIFTNVVGTITLKSALPDLTDISIVGPGARQLTISLSAQPLYVAADSSNTISGLRLERSGATLYGGLLTNAGTLFLTECELGRGYVTFTEDETTGGYKGGEGGAIYNSGHLTILNSTFYDNAAAAWLLEFALGNLLRIYCSGGSGGAIYSASGNVAITNCTFSGNFVGGCDVHNVPGPVGRGGAIFNRSGSLIVVNCTFADNVAQEGSAIYGPVTLINSVVTGPEFSDVTVLDHNLFAADRALAGLGLLQDNGGPTLTHELLPNSPAIEQGTNLGAPPADQRGVVRPQGQTVDIGALEFPWTPNSFRLLLSVNGPGKVKRTPDRVVLPSNTVVILEAYPTHDDYDLGSWSGDSSEKSNPLSMIMNTNKEIGANFVASPTTVTNAPGATNWVANTNAFGPGSLRQAIRNINASGGGTIKFSNVVGTISLGSELPALTYNTIIRGPGKDLLAVIPPPNAGAFVVGSGSTSSISGLTLQYAHATNHDGGAVLNLGNLTLTNVGIVNCNGGTNGGAIFNSGSLTILNSLIRGNWCYHGSGGAIYNAGELFAMSSEISGNGAYFAGNGYGFFPDPSLVTGGGGIYSRTGSVEIWNCKISDNRVYGGGDAESLNGHTGMGGGMLLAAGQMSVISSTIASNVAEGGEGSTTFDSHFGGSGADAFGGGICVGAGLLTASNCTLAYNRASGGSGHEGYSFLFQGAAGGRGCGGGLTIGSAGTGVMVNCTVSLNQATGAVGYAKTNFLEPPTLELGSDASGGGLYFLGNGVFISCTVASNQVAGGVGRHGSGVGRGGGIYKDDFASNNIVSLRNTIVANDLGGSTITSRGQNLFVTGAMDATMTDIQGVDARLGPLQDNGGSTWTHALLAGSPAIDAGESSGLALDQRGQPRTIDSPLVPNVFGGDGTDIGALEVDHILRITQVRKADTNIQVRFTSVSDKAYGVEFKSELTKPSWRTLPDIIAGTGGIATATNLGATFFEERVYRVLERP